MKEQIKLVSRDVFMASLTNLKEDNFAKTFKAKCDMMDIWDKCYGVFDGDKLCCAIVITVSKSKPKIANLQLIHTFFEYRKNGLAKALTLYMIEKLYGDSDYIRVSAEKTAVGFYEKLGFKFLGEQKSGTQLTMCKMTSPDISKCVFDKNDEVIAKALNRNGKGGCVKIFS